MMYLTLYEMNETVVPKDPTERKKLMMPLAEMVKKDIDSGELLMAGTGIGGSRGFLVSKQDPKEIYVKNSMAIPYYKFEVVPMLSIDELIDVMKEMQL